MTWTLPDGRRVDRLTLRGGGLVAQILTLGATVQDLRMEGVDHPLVLGCPDPADYLGGGLYMGAIVGRFANRIGGARFTLDGQEHRTDPNFKNRHTLHGGTRGTFWHLWTVEEARDDSATLSLTLPDGDMGFPGTMTIRADIALRDGALGLGSTPSETVRQVVLPAALPGIVGAVLLAASRAIGETMIVVLGAGAAAQMSLNPLEAMTTITVKIVSQLTGDSDFNSPETLVAFALGLTLFVITLALNVVALYIVRKYREQYE